VVKLRATTNSCSQVSGYGDLDPTAICRLQPETCFVKDVTWPGFNLTRYVLSSLKQRNLLTRCATTSFSRKLLQQEVSQSQFLHCKSYVFSFLAGDEPNGTGVRAYCVREVSRAKCLFCLAHQSAISIAVQQTRSQGSRLQIIPTINKQMSCLLFTAGFL
jgi:hypothetical protein